MYKKASSEEFSYKGGPCPRPRFDILDRYSSSSTITGGMLHVPRGCPPVFPPDWNSTFYEYVMKGKGHHMVYYCQENYQSYCLLPWLLRTFSGSETTAEVPMLSTNGHTSLLPPLCILRAFLGLLRLHIVVQTCARY